MRFAKWLVPALLALTLAACGGGGSDDNSGGSNGGNGNNGGNPNGGSANNVAAVTVGQSIVGQIPNLPYVSVTVCAPGGGTCQTIDNILVDTGSVGLRLMASTLNVALPSATGQGQTLAECGQFVDGYTWGTIRSADIRIAGESASAARVHVIGDTAFPTVPADCSASGGPALNTPAAFGANGVLGIGLFAQDCGPACANAAIGPVYYNCVSDGNCTAAAVPLNQQLQQPVSLFANDNNGTLLSLPAVAPGGAAGATGQLIFGIGTQSNNALGGATALTTSAAGMITAAYNGMTYPSAFLDSGSNGLYFDDSSLSQCSGSLSGYYCPSSQLNLSATLTGTNSASTQASFSLVSANTLFNANNGNNFALPTLGATYGDSTAFDFGLPFFYGRQVFTAIEGQSTPVGNGPYVAF
ncbi:DUF3443 domain-containing protein [Chitinasiproducens palmae]|uniref:DUF3443 domain-containing protein n=1 Tax=Chitinasiproducens palmae TaxID=1770053 RepID=A0A1H2PR88_9BURK|nr:DUF3443 domain-containing protein [Chitinasiproducens palmae]SDV48572.1 Protein of unknown function [Chitinasiproducens palmae]